MIVIGLTGSIGMGKSTVARQCELLGAKSISADAIVHALMQPRGKAFAQVADAFPDAVVEGHIDRKKLGAIAFGDEKKLKRLEQILHPLVATEEIAFGRRMRQKGAKVVVLDIPLLFEAGADSRVDITLVATTTHRIQAQRVLARPNMTPEKFKAILAKQMPDAEKRARADFIVHTGLGKAAAMRQIKLLFSLLGVA